MNRPRIDLGFESSSVTLNLQIASQIGQELAHARAASTLSLDTIASRLVMSKGQIRALERADPDVFYNAKFHAAGLRKYAELLGVQVEGLDRVLIDPNALDDDEDESVDRSDESAFHRAHMAVAGRSLLEVVSRPSRPVALTAVAVVTVAVLSLLVRSIVAEAPVESVATMARVQPSIDELPIRAGHIPVSGTAFSVARLARPASLEAPSVPVVDDTVGHVRVGHSTWVFVRYQDNTFVETVLAAGQQMALDDRPIYVAVGAAEGAEVVIGDTPVDPTGFVVDGELRIGSARLRELTATLQ